jgi:hypothetical protein
MTGTGRYVLAQDANTSPFSITLAPVQFADVKGNVGKFEALNWMPNGAVEGVSDISFVKDINKDISLSVEGSEYTNDNGSGNLTLKDGDKAFLKIEYNAFRKYYDNTGGVYPYMVPVDNTTYTVPPSTTKIPYSFPAADIPASEQGVKANSPDLQLDISYFKLEAGLGEINDPFLDVAYEHDSKNGDKSLLEWTPAYNNTYYALHSLSSAQRQIGPSWEAVNDTVDTVTLTEKKDIAGITIKGEQKAEIDYNNNETYLQYLSPDTSATPENAMHTINESPDAKLFGSGVRAEKWMLNDNTYAALGYHYNHIDDTDLMQTQVQEPELESGIITLVPTSESGWNFSHALEDDHVLVGNLNTNLTPDLAFLADARYEHLGSEGSSNYYPSNTSTTVDTTDMENHEDQEGEHIALRYSGIPHTSLYVESDFDQERNWIDENYSATPIPATNPDYVLNRIDRTQDESWTVGGRVVPNRFFIFSTQVKQSGNNSVYDTVTFTGPAAIAGNNAILLDALKEKGIEEDSTLTWKPFHWLQNSLKYQFSDNVYNPQEATLSYSSSSSVPVPVGGQYPISENHMLTSQFTYDITVEPVDSILLMISYSHVENYVRTLQASEPGADYIPTFNSGDNSWLFSGSYMPMENLTWTSSACYTLSNNYVDFNSGLPLGTNFKELNLTTGFDWTYHKWLKIGPKYEHASYRDNSLAGDGNYSANIFMLDAHFSW